MSDCEKVSYPTEQSAKRGARRMRCQIATRIRVYHCPHCGQWHSTTQSGRDRAIQFKGVKIA